MEQQQKGSLACPEQMAGRKSPEIFPECLPGVTGFMQKRLVPITGKKISGRYNVQLEHDDVRQMNELGQLSPDQLMAHIKNLQNMAYQLGVVEAKELARGKFLKILDNKAHLQ